MHVNYTLTKNKFKKEIVAYSYNRIPLSNKKGWSNDSYNSNGCISKMFSGEKEVGH